MKPEDVLKNLQSLSGPMLWITLVILLIALVANLLYYRTLARTMQAVDPTRRPCPPWMIWLCLIPVIGFIWFIAYIIVLSLALQKELRARNLPGNGAFNITLGTALMFLLFIMPRFRLFAVFPAMLFWLMHWRSMAAYRKLLAEPEYLLVE